MKTKTTKRPDLPLPVKESDLVYPSYKATGRNKQAYLGGEGPDKYHALRFDLWHTVRFGWCIPTLEIRRATPRHASGTQDRTYAVTVADGSVVRIGLGPHVTAVVTVYVTEGRRVALQPLLALQTKGEGDAGDIRDRISTRRANTVLRRGSLSSIYGF